jgi:sialidase-1
MSLSRTITAAILLLPCVIRAADPEQIEVFTAGQDAYHTYRIPALAVTTKGTVLAFAEARKKGTSDTGDIDMVLKRSTDGGKTFAMTQLVWDDQANTCGNPCPIVDRDTGTILLLMTRNLGKDREPDLTTGNASGSRTVWLSKSEDDGQTWSKPIDITKSAKKEGWTWYATGPGAGIQTKSGRLIAPCDHKRPDDTGYSHILYSDDHGKTWQIGGVLGPGVNECKISELSDGSLILNMRNYPKTDQRKRAIATSKDGGITWSQISHDPTLIEPICQASLLRASPTAHLFSNPAHESKRENLTIRLSQDDCKTWPHAQTLHPGPAAYSDLATLPDNTILCLYERGEKSSYERITLARFTLDWLKQSPVPAAERRNE